MEPGAAEDKAAQEANELYWESDASVNQIAAELDLSKGTLYGLISPLVSGLACPRCSAELEYPNRTARDKGFLVCPECGYETEEDGESQLLSIEELAPDDRQIEVEIARSGPAVAPTRVIVGTALLGVAAGIALTLWVRRR